MRSGGVGPVLPLSLLETKYVLVVVVFTRSSLVGATVGSKLLILLLSVYCSLRLSLWSEF